jgi:WhiB family redox-sensing transcriptional regulator
MTIAASHGPAPVASDPAIRRIVPAQGARGDDDTPWEELAACRQADPELFFPIGTTGPAVAQIRQAKAVCAGCPVREPCLAYALSTGQDFGIWGGYDETERRRLRREFLPRRPAAPPRRTRKTPRSA